MSMLDSFFNKGFKGTKCKTMLKLTIPRIKLLRNRKELQIKQMRKDIAKLLETGQEATARIRVEHIIREENMMAAQEIIELYCELIAVRLPIIESQRECPLDLKEAISSVCFAAPRCADLPELLQVQLAFASKYGREFVAAATELMPNCGVNRQLIELLSVRAPSPEKKVKLLKEIAEEHELDWDPAPSETELFKSHEDLLNGPPQFISGAKLPLPKEKHDEILNSSAVYGADEHSYSEDDFDELDFPEVPKGSLKPAVSSEVITPQPSAPHEEHCHASEPPVESEAVLFNQSAINPASSILSHKHESLEPQANPGVAKQFVPFISSPSLSSVSPPVKGSVSSVKENSQSSNLARTRSDATVDFNDVLAAAKAAAESAERAAAAARSAASLAEIRISELSKSQSDHSPDEDTENPFFTSSHNIIKEHNNVQLDVKALGDDNISDSWSATAQFENNQTGHRSGDVNDGESNHGCPPPTENVSKQELPYPQPQRIPSMDDEYFSYPNLFNSQSGNVVSDSHASDNSQPRPGS